MGKRAEDVEHQLPLRGRGVHLLSQAAERDVPRLEIRDRGQQVRQRAAEPVELPDHQAVAGPEKRQGLGQPGAVATAAACPVFEQVALVDAGREQCVTLQVHDLSVTIGGNAHVADQHVRKTSWKEFSHTDPFR